MYTSANHGYVETLYLWLMLCSASVLFEFQHKNNLVRVMQRSCFGFIYLLLSQHQVKNISFLVPQTWLEFNPEVSFKNIQWFHTYKCWNTGSDSGHWLGGLLSELHHHPLHFLPWKPGHKHVMWARYDTFGWNVNMVQSHRLLQNPYINGRTETLTANISFCVNKYLTVC